MEEPKIELNMYVYISQFLISRYLVDLMGKQARLKRQRKKKTFEKQENLGKSLQQRLQEVSDIKTRIVLSQLTITELLDKVFENFVLFGIEKNLKIPIPNHGILHITLSNKPGTLSQAILVK